MTYKNIRGAHLRVDDPTGPIQVSAPSWATLPSLEDFVREHASWIERRRLALAAEKPSSRKRGHLGADGLVMLWGREVPVVELCPRVSVDACGVPLGFAKAEASVVKVLRGEVLRASGPYIERYEGVLGVHATQVRVRDTSSRWGSCTVKTGHVSLALSLGHYDPVCLEYVVAHELCHLIVPNHGPRFKACLDRCMPSWRQVKAALDQAARFK